MIIALMNPCADDPNAYKNPDEFNPENFLDDHGKLSIPECFIPFGAGKRRCLGEIMARTNLFLFCTSLIQNFIWSVPEGHDLPCDEPVDGLAPSVKDYEATITLRK